MGLSLMTQIISMGYYQLSRLKYCFSNDQIHSTKGYPKWLFIFMYVLGIILCINWILWMTSTNLSADDPGTLFSFCGIKTRSNYEFHQSLITTFNIQWREIWGIILAGFYLIWDLFTLSLYVYKIRAFRKFSESHKNEAVNKRISSILHKIFILTMFYEIVALMVILLMIPAEYVFDFSIWVTYDLIACIISPTFLYAMHLMMEHNKERYFEFLQRIYYLKLHWICCKYRYIVIDQIEEFESNLAVMIESNTIKHQDGEKQTKRISGTGTLRAMNLKGPELSIDSTIYEEA